MENLKYIERNKHALEEFQNSYADMTIPEVFDQYPTDAIHLLVVILGFGCAECGSKQISARTLNFYKYQPTVRCWGCQHKK